MEAERFAKLRRLFEDAIARSAEEREVLLTQACAGDPELRVQVDKLLLAHDRTGDVLDPGTGYPRMEGRRIGPYELVRKLGQGGMGAVYLARRADEAFKKQVAVKLMRPDLLTGDLTRRFHQERQILANLEHPNIARLLDGGTTLDGLPYLVLEYVEGVPLTEYCDAHRMSVLNRIRLFETVCEAIQYAHEHGIVHRDLKPSNILVTTEGTVKLLDFGIAKLMTTQSWEITAFGTATGLHLMTPEYASPEQIKGEPTTGATDVYALGVVLYELLTGHRPYRLRSKVLHELARVICEEHPTRPSAVVSEHDEELHAPTQVSAARQTTPARLSWLLSGELDSIILRALEKDPERRYSTPRDLTADLVRHEHGLPVSAHTSRIRGLPLRLSRRTRLGLVLSVLVFALRSFYFPAVIIAMSIPLVLQTVPPNRWYGVRTQKSLSSLELWYKVNYAAGWLMIAAALLTVFCSTVILRMHPEWATSRLAQWTNIFMIVSLTAAIFLTLIYVRKA